MVYSTLRPMLFSVDPEKAHNLSISALKLLQTNPFLINQYYKKMNVKNPRLKSSYWGVDFDNPVGLAAGFDKNGEVYSGLYALGFGTIEVGSVTPLPQEGNPKPRLYRLKEDNGLINRMGFNSKGVYEVEKNFVTTAKTPLPIGINLGKNKITPNAEAALDYIKGLEVLYKHGDYFVINISSPNTKNLRDLQHITNLYALLTQIINKRNNLLKELKLYRPIILKVAPDLTPNQIEQVVETALSAGIEGLIVSNTTIEREGLHSVYKKEEGGLSGRPLVQKSTELIYKVYKQTQGKIPIIGSGGIFTGMDAFEKLAAGANLVQVYTGMIYRGPSIAKHINNELIKIMDQRGFNSVEEVIGSAHQE
ncbi:quinone-dependent dihydroorotate dehydrogenase [Priestia sp. JNUCC 25]